MSDVHSAIERIESTIRQLGARRVDRRETHRIICESLQDLARIPRNSSLSLAGTFEAIVRHGSSYTKKEVGSAIIRLVCCPEILSAESVTENRRYLVQLIEEGCADLLSKVVAKKRAQTHEKLEAVTSIHRDACNRLAVLCSFRYQSSRAKFSTPVNHASDKLWSDKALLKCLWI